MLLYIIVVVHLTSISSRLFVKSRDNPRRDSAIRVSIRRDATLLLDGSPLIDADESDPSVSVTVLSFGERD